MRNHRRTAIVLASLAFSIPGVSSVWGQIPSTAASPPPAAQASGIAKIYTRNSMVRLPVQMDERTRADVTEVHFYAKGPNGVWTCREKASPLQPSFDFRAEADGEYAFTFVTINRQGKVSPANLDQSPPHRVVVIDSKPPEVLVRPVPVANRDIFLVCEIRDANPDWASVRLSYMAGDNSWKPLEVANPTTPYVFRIPDRSVLDGRVLATASDKAGNSTTREVDLGDPTQPFGNVKITGPDSGKMEVASNPPAALPESLKNAAVEAGSKPASGIVPVDFKVPVPDLPPSVPLVPANSAAPLVPVKAPEVAEGPNLVIPPMPLPARVASTSEASPASGIVLPMGERPLAKPTSMIPAPGPTATEKPLIPDLPDTIRFPEPNPKVEPVRAVEPNTNAIGNKLPKPEQAPKLIDVPDLIKAPELPKDTAPAKNSQNVTQPDSILLPDLPKLPDPTMSTETSPAPIQPPPGLNLPDPSKIPQPVKVPEPVKVPQPVKIPEPTLNLNPNLEKSPVLAPEPAPKFEADKPFVPFTPMETPKATAPEVERPSHPILNTRTCSINYALEGNSRSSNKIDFWATRDNGKTWEPLRDEAGGQPPARLVLPADGLFGIRIRPNGNGQMPVSGDSPDCFVEIDTVKPAVRMLAPTVGKGEDSGTMLIPWAASDHNLVSNSINIWYATQPEGAWEPIVSGYKNEGIYRWAMPTGIQGKVYLRIEASDRAGNVGRSELKEPIVLDNGNQRVRVIGVGPAK